MTYEEAKECKRHLEMLKSEIEWDKPIGYQIDLDLAINALKKQIPKKPIHRVAYAPAISNCPICGDLLMKNAPYCVSCGQAIDWSEEE